MKEKMGFTSMLISIAIIFTNPVLAEKRRNKLFFDTPPEYASKVKRAVPPAGVHPRLFVRPDGIDGLRARYEYDSPQTNQLREWLLKEASYNRDGKVSDGKAKENIYKAYAANAFLYLIFKDEKKGIKAKNLVLNYFRTLADGTYDKGGKAFESRKKMNSILTAAMVYDWCYDLFTAEERRKLIKEVVDQLVASEFGWPIPLNAFDQLRDYVGPHWAEEKHALAIAFGIACYDEDPSIYDAMAEHLYERFAPIRNIIYEGHKFPQGSGYYGRFTHEVMSAALITGMGGENPYTENQPLLYYYPMYGRRPDGRPTFEGDGARISNPYESTNILGIIIAASQYQDPILQGQVHQYWHALSHRWQRRRFSAALLFCVYDEKLEAVSHETLPLTRYFPGPAGNMIARTGWGLDTRNPIPDTPVAIVKMDVNEYDFCGHTHADAGHFSIYYKGPLAIDSGTYDSYGGSHFRNYFTKTVAHNSLLIFDPKSKPGRGANDGGQVASQNYTTFEDLETIAKRGKVLAHDFGPGKMTPEYSYLRGDITRAYRAWDLKYPNKAKEVKRSFVFLNHFNDKHPASLMVFDRVTARNPNFKKTWLLHAIEKPVLDGNVQTIVRGNSGFQEVSEIPYRGKLVNQVLLPSEDNAVFTLIGGKGREFENQGKNYPLEKPEMHDLFEAGHWRIEVSPKKARATDLFLNVMQIMDANDGSTPLKVEKIENDDLVGAQISDRLVLFPKGQARINREVEFAVSHGPVKCLVTGLSAGMWNVMAPSGSIAQRAVSAEAGTLYLAVTAGAWTLVPADNEEENTTR